MGTGLGYTQVLRVQLAVPACGPQAEQSTHSHTMTAQGWHSAVHQGGAGRGMARSEARRGGAFELDECCGVL